jgi:glycosyltransferase involved in cell wall biosynthesis
MTIKYSIVLPCYNEEKNLVHLIRECEKSLCKNDIEVILVNNGSTDNTNKILDNYDFDNDLIKYFTLEKNQGYGGGILFGLSMASGDFIGWSHADLQTDMKDVIKGFDMLTSKSCFVKGRREGRSFFDNFFTLGMSIIETIIFRKFLYDINGQPTLFSKDFYLTWKNPPSDFSLDLYAYSMAKFAHMKVKKFRVVFKKRFSGKSSWNNGIKSRIVLIQKTLKFSINHKKFLNQLKN